MAAASGQHGRGQGQQAAIPQFRKGGFKQHLREELRNANFTNADANANERAQNQAARERQERARQENQRPAQSWHEINREAQEQQSRERQQRQQTAQEAQIARIMARRKKGLENELENDGGRDLEP